ncbi:hypothetical protein G6F56_008485 [Rhizopus delemar]|nr:hypothetical protein G6F56_008485 [Rhizopus delemar]
MIVGVENSKLKYVFIATLITCIIWFTYRLPDELPLVSDSQEDPLCTPETFNIGQWIHNASEQKNVAQRAGYHCIKKKFAHRCFNRPSAEERLRSQKMWQPSQCQLLEMNTGRFGQHLIENPVLFVGDSITQLQFESLSCLLGHLFHKRQPKINGGNPRLRVSEIGDENKTALAYIRSDYLVRLDDFKLMEPFDETGRLLGSGENYPWVHAIPDFKYIIINTAPHWHVSDLWGENQSEQELLSAYENAMIKLYQYLKEHTRPDQKVWIRTTPYGHAQCSQITSPQSSPLEPSGRVGEYDWHLFKEFDAIWRKLLEDNRFQLFNITNMSNKRGDAHSKPDKDCLHTCLPGPVDDWNRLLYHELMK